MTLEHLHASPREPSRVVVVGASGFVGGAVVENLRGRGIAVEAIARSRVDLTADGAVAVLAALVAPGDVVVAAAARAPCKDVDMLVENLRIARTLVHALATVELAQVVNIGSDAVYADAAEPLTEGSCAAPDSLHGAMHLAREVALRTGLQAPLALLRPTLIYGASDPHNGYGPNRFRRLAAAGEAITLFGEGEERRDHVLVDDVAEVVARVILHRSRGVLNVATGEVHAFRAVAHEVVAVSGRSVEVRGSPRKGPIPHNGYRAFDPAACRAAFPDFAFTPLAVGLERAARSAGRAEG